MYKKQRIRTVGGVTSKEDLSVTDAFPNVLDWDWEITSEDGMVDVYELQRKILAEAHVGCLNLLMHYEHVTSLRMKKCCGSGLGSNTYGPAYLGQGTSYPKNLIFTDSTDE